MLSFLTLMLIEDVLKIGAIDEPDINAKLYVYYKDSTLRNIISDVRKQFSNISDVEKELSKSEYERLLNAAKSKQNKRLYYLLQTI